MGDSEIEAMSAVAEALADLPEEARGRVVKWAADRYGVTLGGGVNHVSRRVRGVGAEGGSSSDGDAPQMEEADVMAAVSAETAVPVEKLEKVFHIDGAAVKLLGPSSNFGANAAAQARSVAQVVAVVRKLGMGSVDTSFDIIKDACASKHCYDSKNFATVHIPKIDGFVVKGDGKGRRLEARGAGLKAFPALIDKILGES